MTRIIPLTQGYFTFVDDADYEWLRQWSWHIRPARNSLFYAGRSGRKQGKYYSVYMHRAILAAATDEKVDHENHNGLDNRRCNLRICTTSQNGGNQRKGRGSSQYKGVYWEKRYQVWEGQFFHERGKKTFLGYFDSEEEAARAYDCLAKQKWGEFALLNFPE